MKKLVKAFPLLIVAMALLTSCNEKSNSTDNTSYGDATKELMVMVNNDTLLKSLLVSSIQKAKEINPDSVTNPAQSLEQYYAFVSKAESSMPWGYYMTDHKLPSTFEHIFQSLGAFYFVIDQPLAQLEGKGLFHNSLQYDEPFAKWLTTFNKSWQKYLDSEKSWSDEYYKIVASDPAFGLQNGWYEDPKNWKTFNHFFARHLSSVSARPIASPEDNSVLASYADAVPQGVWAIDSSSTIVDKEGVTVKSAHIKHITKLLGDDSQYKNAFANGTFTHSFLNVNDYHRYHFPMSGTIKEVRIIQGLNPTGGIITWSSDKNKYEFDPSSTNWQMLETRGCVILDTNDYGLVALLPIGMSAVGSVNFEQSVKVGQKVKKGDGLGYFLFGGSDFIMIFQDKVRLTLDAPKESNSNYYKHLLMGERLGHLTINK
ncbi:MAG: phosphatidylserine decarboxylase [Cyclobacteriaceae bacterium]|nr:phosphatidylserine decarboxylase [Cyclobacteriaceae bacterium]